MGPRKKKAVSKNATEPVEKEEIAGSPENVPEKTIEESTEVAPESTSSKTPISESIETTNSLPEPSSKEHRGDSVVPDSTSPTKQVRPDNTVAATTESQVDAAISSEANPQAYNDLDEEEEDFTPKIAVGSADDLKSRLFQLRMKINQSRKANQKEVEEEFQRVTFNKRKDKVKEDDDDEQRGPLDQTAAEAEWEAMKAEKKKETAATYGLNAFTSDAYYRAYEKRVSKLQHDKRVEASKQDEDEELDYDPLSYGKTNAAVSADALDRLQKDVLDREEQRKKYSRKRPELGDVDYINEKNQNFNKKLKRAFDKYTVEIRQNLERGTAI